MPPRPLKVEFPLAGLDRGQSYQRQPPYTTPAACNVRSRGTAERRMRGGSRPGWELPQSIGNYAPGTGVYSYRFSSRIDLITEVDYRNTTGFDWWEDSFRGQGAGGQWAAFDAQPTFYPEAGLIGVPYTNGTDVKGLKSGTIIGGVAGNYQVGTSHITGVSIYIVPYQGAHHGAYYLYCLLDDATGGLATSGIRLTFVITGSTGIYSGKVTYIRGGVTKINEADITGGTLGYPAGGWLTIRVLGDQIRCYWRHAEIFNQSIDATYTGLGSRVAVQMKTTVAGGRCQVARFQHRYQSAATSTISRNTRRLLVASGGNLFIESPHIHFHTVTNNSGVSIQNGTPLQATQFGSRLYLANVATAKHFTEPNDVDTNLYWRTGQNPKIVSKTVIPSTVQAGDVCVIVRSARPATLGAYSIVGWDLINGYYVLELAWVAGIVASETAPYTRVTYRVYPKTCYYDIDRNLIFDEEADVGFDGTARVVPPNCPLICTYRNRIVRAGEPPDTYYVSGYGNPANWDMMASADNPDVAYYGQIRHGGGSPDRITALIPGGDDYLLIAGERGLWRMIGDANIAAGGMLGQIIGADGAVGANAWCRIPGQGVAVLSYSGLYLLGIGSQVSITPLSEGRLPRELRGLNSDLYHVVLVWDACERGIHIWLSGNASSQKHLHWWFDWEARAFWPVDLASEDEPTSATERIGLFPSDAGPIFGTRTGWLVRPDPYAIVDRSAAIASYVLCGPFRVASEPMEGILLALLAELPTDTGRIKWSILQGATPDAALAASPAATGYWVAGQNYMDRPEVRVQSFFIKLEAGDTYRPWEIESLTATLQSLGVPLWL